MNAVEVADAARRFFDRPPAEVLAWAAEAFRGRVVFATGFGAEGCVLIDLIARHRLPIDLFTLDTGLLFPETYALWRRLEERYGVAIRGVRPNQTVEEQARAHGERLWERDPDRCCALRKVEPLRVALARLRRLDHRHPPRPDGRARAAAAVVERDLATALVKVNPLVTWTSADVAAYVRAHDVPANPLHEQGYPSIGCVPCTSPVRPGEDPRAGRWRGRDKTECGLHARPPQATPILPSDSHRSRSPTRGS